MTRRDDGDALLEPPLAFVHGPSPTRVVFADGALARLGDEVERLGLERTLLISTPGRREQAEAIAHDLGGRAAGVHAGARMHVPVETVDEAVAVVADLGVDGCVTVGGGSTVGLGKAVALRTGLPVVAVATTYAGSEMTPVWGLTEDGEKRTGRDPRVLPRTVVYDPRLTTGLPVPTSVTSGLNAVAHAVEGLYAPDRSPLVSLMAAESIRAITRALPMIAADPGSAPGRHLALLGAWLAGSTLGATTMGLHHKLCHALGGTLGLPHAETHAVVLPHVLAFNLPAVDAGVRRALADAVAPPSGDTAPGPAVALRALAASLGAPTSLAALGAPRNALPGIAARAAASPYGNPRPASEQDIALLLDRAWQGVPPRDG